MLHFVIWFCSIALVVSSPPSRRIEDVRIVGGYDIDISEAPYQVSLVDRGRHACGGSIIAPDLVLTAAHCVTGSFPYQYKVRVGSSSSKSGGKLVQVADMIWHPDFSFNRMDNDVALLWLESPLEFNENVSVVEIADEDHEIKDGDLADVSGWGNLKEGGGVPSTLQMVHVSTVSEAKCKAAYEPFYKITPRMLCAGEVTGGKDACQGDSGGPLVHDGKLSGVVSWGVGCARPDFPGVYAKVSALKDWIDDNSTYLRMKHLLRGRYQNY